MPLMTWLDLQNFNKRIMERLMNREMLVCIFNVIARLSSSGGLDVKLGIAIKVVNLIVTWGCHLLTLMAVLWNVNTFCVYMDFF